MMICIVCGLPIESCKCELPVCELKTDKFEKILNECMRLRQCESFQIVHGFSWFIRNAMYLNNDCVNTKEIFDKYHTQLFLDTKRHLVHLAELFLEYCKDKYVSQD